MTSPLLLLAAEAGGFEAQIQKVANFIWLQPEWLNVWLMPLYQGGLATAFLVGWILLIKAFQPKISAVALTTAKEALLQPLFFLLLGVGLFLLVLFQYLPYNTFGEDVKVVKDNSLTLIMVLGILLALWTASVSISDEIEGRTAVTLLSKPISRRHFVFGKLWGIVIPVAIFFIILGTVFLWLLAYKIGYDARENASAPPDDLTRLQETVQVIPGLVLAFMEAVVFTAISVAISTRLPMLPNLIICFSIYLLGHLVPTLVVAAGQDIPLVGFVGNLIATLLPNLETFNITEAVATDTHVPLVYLLAAAVYCLFYTAACTLLALIMFEDRDLA